MNRHDEVGERSATVGGMRRSMAASDLRRMAIAMAVATTLPSDRQENLTDVFADERRRYLTGEPRYNEEQRKAAEAIRADRERRKSENWVKRQPKGKS